MCLPCTVRGATDSTQKIPASQASSVRDQNMGTVSVWPVEDPESDQGEEVSVPSLGPPYLFLLWPLKKPLSDEWAQPAYLQGFGSQVKLCCEVLVSCKSGVCFLGYGTEVESGLS